MIRRLKKVTSQAELQQLIEAGIIVSPYIAFDSSSNVTNMVLPAEREISEIEYEQEVNSPVKLVGAITPEYYVQEGFTACRLSFTVHPEHIDGHDTLFLLMCQKAWFDEAYVESGESTRESFISILLSNAYNGTDNILNFSYAYAVNINSRSAFPFDTDVPYVVSAENMAGDDMMFVPYNNTYPNDNTYYLFAGYVCAGDFVSDLVYELAQYRVMPYLSNNAEFVQLGMNVAGTQRGNCVDIDIRVPGNTLYDRIKYAWYLEGESAQDALAEGRTAVCDATTTFFMSDHNAPEYVNETDQELTGFLSVVLFNSVTGLASGPTQFTMMMVQPSESGADSSQGGDSSTDVSLGYKFTVGQDNTAYFNTGYVPNTDTVVQIKGIMKKSFNGKGHGLETSVQGGYQFAVFGHNSPYENTLYFERAGYNNMHVSVEDVDYETHEYEFGNYYIKVDGNQLDSGTPIASTNDNDKEFYIFALNDVDSDNTRGFAPAGASIEYVKFLEPDGNGGLNLEMDLRPALDASGNICLYDQVAGDVIYPEGSDVNIIATAISGDEPGPDSDSSVDASLMNITIDDTNCTATFTPYISSSLQQQGYTTMMYGACSYEDYMMAMDMATQRGETFDEESYYESVAITSGVSGTSVTLYLPAVDYSTGMGNGFIVGIPYNSNTSSYDYNSHVIENYSYTDPNWIDPNTPEPEPEPMPEPEPEPEP